jgi:hypothetical protein
MKIDIDHLTREELVELNTRISERLQFLNDPSAEVPGDRSSPGHSTAASPGLEERFHEMLLQSYRDVGRATGYWAHRFRQKVVRVGGVRAAKDWLAKKEIPSGLDRVIEVGRPDLALEAIVLADPWSQLFTPAERAIARRRLDEALARHQQRG